MKRKTSITKIASILTMLAMVWGGVACQQPTEPVEPTKYTISFDSGVESITVEEGAVATEPTPAPEKTGYKFGGWLNGEAAYDWTQPVTSNLSLTAKWTAVKYTITYLPEGVEKDTYIKSYTIESDAIVLDTNPTSPDATKPNFVAWHKGTKPAEGEWAIVDSIEKGTTGDLIIVAEFSDVKPWIVTFDSDGGSTVNALKVVDGNKATEPKAPTKDGYEFDGWYNGETKFNFATVITSDITLKAHWKQVITYTITFDSDGGSTVNALKVVDGNKATEPKAPTKDGYEFDGWYNGETKFNFATVITSDITLKAHWKQVTTYTITFDSDGGTEVKSQTIKEGEKATKPENPTLEGRSFACWLQSDGTEFDFSKPVTSDIVLKAKWIVAVVVQEGEIKVKKGLCSSVTISDNGDNYQLAMEVFAANASYKAKIGDKLLIKVKGSSDKAIPLLKCVLVGTSEADKWWNVLSGYKEFGAIPAGEFEKEIEMDITADAATAGAPQKLVFMYDKADGVEASTLTFSTFEINGKSSLPPFNRETAKLINKWTKAEMDAIKDFSITGEPDRIGEGNMLNASVVYCIITVNLNDSTKIGWGAGAICNYQEPLKGDDGSANVISISGKVEGEQEIIYSLEEIYDAIKAKGVEEPKYFNFNVWADYLDLISVEIMKM